MPNYWADLINYINGRKIERSPKPDKNMPPKNFESQFLFTPISYTSFERVFNFVGKGINLHTSLVEFS